jgi:BirA family biotin operon repressor/biotin-[acetyl-CoA-carboxylase] ligase
MATPYLQFRHDEVASTQDLARGGFDRLPVVVVASRQTAGRGRSGAGWITAPRALATSVAFRAAGDDRRPFSLMAAVAAVRALEGVSLKWPNDVLLDTLKVGGMLVELSGDIVVVGMGLNLWWPDAPYGAGSLQTEDPGPELHARIAGVWAAELLQMVEVSGWPVDEYRSSCATLGREITWDPDGRGTAVDIGEGGELVVDEGGVRRIVNSGAIRHVRG